MKDVIEGQCGCGLCRWIEDGRCWDIGDPSDPEQGVDLTVEGHCPAKDCRYRLDADGKGRRMLDVTAEELRRRIADLERLDQEAAARDDLTDTPEAKAARSARIDELERLLPEEGEG